MNRDELSKSHWRYYLMLEKRFMESIEYVELHKDNHGAFSNEYALLLQAIGAELDTVFKVFCNFKTSDTKNISHYAKYILTNNIEIKGVQIEIRQFDMEIQPFVNWNQKKPKQSLVWWEAFDNIKHNRFEHLQDASQENVLNMLGALYLLEMMYLNNITKDTDEYDIFDEESKLFTLKGWKFRVTALSKMVAVTKGEVSDVILS